MSAASVLWVLALIAVAGLVIYGQMRAVRAERALAATNRFAIGIIENAGEGIIVYDRDLNYLVFNRFMEDLTGLRAIDVIGRNALEVFPHLREQHVDVLLHRALAGETIASPDVRYFVPASGREGWVSAVYRPHYDQHGRIAGVIGLIRDVTERKAAEQQVEYQAYHDSLTGLANRRLFEEHLTLALALAQRRERLVGVLFLDLDRFKRVNDSLGHSAGDALLREVAQRLKASVREGDTVGRVGGDEFTIVLHDLASPDDAILVAQKLLLTVAEPMDLSGSRLCVTTSIGITIFPQDGEDAETLLKKADGAMYHAKAEGRNRYEMAAGEPRRSRKKSRPPGKAAG